MSQMSVNSEGGSSSAFFKDNPIPIYGVLFYVGEEDESLFGSYRQFVWVTVERKSDVTVIHTRPPTFCRSMRFFYEEGERTIRTHEGDIIVVEEDTSYAVDMRLNLECRMREYCHGALWTKMIVLRVTSKTVQVSV